MEFEVFDEESLKEIVRERFGLEGDLEEILSKMSEKFELYTISIPTPRDGRLIKMLKGFRIDPKKVCDLDERTLNLLTRYFKQIEEPFVVREVYENDGVRIVIAEDLDELIVLETNVDDVSGEVIPYVLDRVLDKAIDAYVFQCIGKKGRPCLMLKVLVDNKNALDVAGIMCKELPTLGVRMYKVCRYKVGREVTEKVVDVFGKEFKLRVKVSDVSIKPEFEDVKRIAENLNKPLPAVYIEILRRLRDEDFNWECMSR